MAIHRNTLLLLAILFPLACEEEESINGNFSVYLTDSPCENFATMNIEIVDVKIRKNQNADWQSLSVKAGIYDVLKLTNGKEALIATGNFSDTSISDIRLILGNRNSSHSYQNVSDELAYPDYHSLHKQDYDALTTAQRTHDFKVNLNPAKHHRVLLDFDVAKSTIGYGVLSPSIRYIDEVSTGTIRGKLPAFDVSRVLYAVTSTDTVASFANKEGEFILHGISPGLCKLVIPTRGKHLTKIVEQIDVIAGQTTDLGQTSLDDFIEPGQMFRTDFNFYWNRLETKISDDAKYLIVLLRTCKYDCMEGQLVGPYDCREEGPAMELHIQRSKLIGNTEIKLNNDVPFLEDPKSPNLPQDGSFLIYYNVVDDHQRARYIFPQGTLTISNVSNGMVSGHFDAFPADPTLLLGWISGTFNDVPMNPTVVTAN